MTRGENFRKQVSTDEGLAKFIEENLEIEFCPEKPKCRELFDTGHADEIAEEECHQCLVKWLQSEGAY